MKLHLPKLLLAAVLAAATMAQTAYGTPYELPDQVYEEGEIPTFTASSNNGDHLLYNYNQTDHRVTTNANVTVNTSFWVGSGNGTTVTKAETPTLVQLTGVISGAGTLKLNEYPKDGTTGNFVIYELSNSSSTFSGTISLEHGHDTHADAQLVLKGTGTAYQDATVNGNGTASGIVVVDGNISLGGLTGSNARVVSTSASNTLTLNVTGAKSFSGNLGNGTYHSYTIGTDDTTFTDATSTVFNLTKTGTGTQTLSGTVNLGTVNVSGGTLALTGTYDLSSIGNVDKGCTLSLGTSSDQSQAGAAVLGATGEGTIKSAGTIKIVGSTGTTAALSSSFAGTIEMTANTLYLGNAADHWQAHSVALDSATIKLTGTGGLRVGGDNLSAGSVWVAGDGANSILSHETKASDEGRGFYADTLKLDSNVRINANWGSALAFGELSGSGELRAWYVNTNGNNKGMTLTLDSVKDYTGAIVIGKNASDALTHAAYVTVNIGSAGKTSVLDSAISNYGTLNIGTAAAEGVTASTTTIKHYITNEGTVSLSGDIVLGTDMSKYDIAAPGEGGSYSYDENNGFFTAAGTTYYLVKGNADNITLNTQQAKLDTGSVILEKNYDGVVFTNTQSSTSAEFFITKGELTRSALIADTTTTKVTADTKFIVQGEGTLALSNETMDAGMVSLQGTTSTVKLGTDATLTNGSELFSKVTGSGTVEIATTDGYSSTFTANSGFSGTTHVKSGNFTINSSTFGNKLKLANNVEFQLTGGSKYEFAAGKELILEGTSKVHQNTSATLTFKGDVSGTGTYYRKGGGTLTFDGTVNLGTFYVEDNETTNKFNGNTTIGTLTAKAANNNKTVSKYVFNGNTTIGTLTASGGTFDYEAGAHTVTTLDMANGGSATSTVTLKKNETAGKEVVLTASTLWLRSAATLAIEEGATLKLGTNGIVNIKGTAGSTASAVSSSNTDTGAKYLITGTDQNGGDSTAFTISNAEVSVDTSSGAQTISNILSNSKLINAGSNKLTTTNGNSNFSAIDATKGNIDLTWFNQQGRQGVLQELSIGADKIVGIYTGYASATPATDNEATITVASLTAGTGATLNANLVLSNGATVTLANALTMGSTLTLGKGMTLSGDLVSTIQGMSDDGTVNLFTGVDALYLGDSTTASAALDATSGVNLDTYFDFEGASKYYLGYSGGSVFAGVMPIPEPTTATLSLLALAGLAARRRRR